LKSLSYDGSDVDDPQSYRPSRADRALGAPDDPAQVAGRPWFNFARASQEFGFSRMSDDPDHPHFHLFRVLRADDDVDIDGTMGTGDPGEGNGAWDGERHADVSGDGVVNTVLGSQADARDFVAEQIERSTIGWAQAGIKVEMTGAINFDNPPQFPAGHANAGDLVFIDDGLFDAGSGNDEEIIIESTAGDGPEVVEVFFVPPADGAFEGLASAPALRGGVVLPAAKAENTYLFIMSSARVERRVLAHEVWHGLARQGDDNRPVYIYAPSLDDMTLDDTVERQRRIRPALEQTSRVLKAPGDVTAGGSRLLSAGN